MSTQVSLFDSPPLPAIARKSDPVSSKEAAAKITNSGTRKSQCNTILALVKRYPGRTSLELAELTFEYEASRTIRHRGASRRGIEGQSDAGGYGVIQAICKDCGKVFMAAVILGLCKCPKCGSDKTAAAKTFAAAARRSGTV